MEPDPSTRKEQSQTPSLLSSSNKVPWTATALSLKAKQRQPTTTSPAARLQKPQNPSRSVFNPLRQALKSIRPNRQHGPRPLSQQMTPSLIRRASWRLKNKTRRLRNQWDHPSEVTRLLRRRRLRKLRSRQQGRRRMLRHRLAHRTLRPLRREARRPR
ncbi:hypothetical protein M011DRAFT_180169 [Sporormia fimetaria CBS 119925]|uniref:Uncharacterized protein n=1 Tax=Sporormia fimetaria CBS 119925 TaxID=1340428 RepID=A0A6A6VLL7_9PLEO|nr:hypothetical protein M011DRAFT_180169 [Sporormia fimetaria CBS 119925]